MSTGNQQQLQRYAQPLFVGSVKNDTNAPFSYKDWYSTRSGIIPGQEFTQYNDYLVNWYKDKSLEVTDFKLQLKLNYLTLLRQLQIFFSKEEAENWYSRVDINDEKELLLAIPYFAKKLKDIAFYYLQLRENIKASKLRYNEVGTNTGIIEELQNLILKNYTQSQKFTVAIPSSVWRKIPALSSVKDTINFEIEELYDSQNYLDLSPTLPVSAYFDVNSSEVANFLSTKGLSISSTEWIYKLGIQPLSGFSFEQELAALSASNVYQDEIYNNILEYSNLISQKYLGGDKFTAVTTTPSAALDFYEQQIQSGVNYFLWPAGTYPEKALQYPRYAPQPLSSTKLETTATAGSSIELADTIFIRSAEGTKGAWLYNKQYDVKNKIVQATLDANKTTIFRYPFPGYGISATNDTWSGFSFASDPRYFYLDNNLKQAIQNVYWSTNINLSTTNILSINDTTLIDNKAYPNADSSKSDKVRVRKETPSYNTLSYISDTDEAWLYRYDKTDISIANNGDSVIVWPFEKIDPTADFPSYYPTNLNNFCDPVAVSAIKFDYAVAGDALSGADIIYKIKNYKDTAETAVECCWLSGSTITPTANSTNFYIGRNRTVDQPALQLNVASGSYAYFIWNGPDNTDADTVFRSYKHQSDCKYVTTPGTTYLDYSLCTCKQNIFTPFGHPGDKLNDNGGFTDIIAVDTFSPGSFNFNSWVGVGGVPASQSLNFAWYNTNNVQGWGDGTWKSGSTTQGNKFYLRTGFRYIYYRANVPTKDKEIVILPEYILRYSYNNYNNVNYKWIKAVKGSDNVWYSANTPSTMVLNPGDLLLYTRKENTTLNVIGSQVVTQDISENRGSIWSNYDYISIGKGSTNIDKQVTLSYPTINYTPLTATQYPAANLNILSFNGWTIIAPDNSRQTYRNTSTVTFVPNITGLYTASVTAITATAIPTPANYTSGTFSYVAGTTGIYIFTNIPPVTALPNTVLVDALTGYNTPVPGFVLNTKLKGWDYKRNIYNPYCLEPDAGAKPLWAKLYNKKDSNTKFVGGLSWGTSLRVIDNYNIIAQPEISDITLQIGSYVEYIRNYPADLTWIQPIVFSVLVNDNQWCALNINTTTESNLSDILNNYKNELTVVPTTAVSDIVLQNFIDNKPLEVYYTANNPFVWNITATPILQETVFANTTANLAIKATAPWANLSNQIYPTFAAFPTVENLHSISNIGGYFTPKNLGVSVFTDKDYTSLLSLSSAALNNYFNDITKYFDNKGLTKANLPTPYAITENSVWLKEPTTTRPLAGTIKKNVFKKHQKFIPYQSGYETNPRLRIGLLTPTSRQTPWGGKNDLEWVDTANKPTSYTGELNVAAWANSQILKQNKLQVDNWSTDIFGNQYGLYKNIKNVAPVNRKNITGEIWVRKNSQFTSPGYNALAGVFDTYTGTNLIQELTGTGIRKIDTFFDTLMIETSGTVILEKLIYNYNTDSIFSLTDQARYLSLAMPVQTNLDKEFVNTNLTNYTFAKAGETWFFPNKKLVTLSVCGLSGTTLIPELYTLNLNTQIFNKIFPSTQEDISLINELVHQNIVNIDPPVLSYNDLKGEYLFTIHGTDISNKDVLIEIKIKDLPIKVIDTINVYTPNTNINTPPYITQELTTTVTNSVSTFNTLNFQCIANTTDVVYTPITLPSWVSLSPTGLFTGLPPKETKNYEAVFAVSNSAGPTYYSLVIKTIYYPVTTNDYLLLDDETGYVLQENTDKIVIAQNFY